MLSRAKNSKMISQEGTSRLGCFTSVSHAEC